MTKVREAFVEVVIILFVGSLIGAVLAAVSNLFVLGVQFFTKQRELSELLFVRPSIKKKQFSNGSILGNTTKVNVFVCLVHRYTSILTLKMYFDYKRFLVYYALDLRFFVGETLYSEHSLNPCDFFF